MAIIAVGNGLFLCRQPAREPTAPNPMLGNILGAVPVSRYALVHHGSAMARSGSTSAAATIGRRLLRQSPGRSVMALPMALPVTSSTPSDWAIVVFLGVFQIGVAYAFLVRGVARVPALEASLILLAEPVLSPIWAWLVHGEAPTAWALAGGAIILGATVAMTMTGSPELNSQFLILEFSMNSAGSPSARCIGKLRCN